MTYEVPHKDYIVITAKSRNDVNNSILQVTAKVE